MVSERPIVGFCRSVPGTPGNVTVHVVGGRSPFPYIRGGNGTTPSALFGIRGPGGSGAFVGAGRRSLALSERSELASDGRGQRRHPRCLCWRVSERAGRHTSANRIPRLSCSGTPCLSCSLIVENLQITCKQTQKANASSS